MTICVVLSTEKVKAAVFWDSHAIILVDYLKKGKTINDEYDAKLLQQLTDKVKQKQPYLAKKNELFH